MFMFVSLSKSIIKVVNYNNHCFIGCGSEITVISAFQLFFYIRSVVGNMGTSIEQCIHNDRTIIHYWAVPDVEITPRLNVIED